MSTEVPSRGHRHSRSAAMPPTSTPSQNPHNPHHFNQQAHERNSESETKVIQPVLASQSTTPPRTPRRDRQPASQNPNTIGPDSGSKQKPRSKTRPKNVNTSPAVMKNGRNSPPLTGTQSAGITSSAKPINTPSATAYAGPTFHASPDPRTLPMPSFYSKSVPDSPGVKDLKSIKESQTKKETPSPNNMFTPPPANNQFQREESPLDFFFKADREEKARARSASSTQTAGPTTGPFQPPMASPRSSQTPPALAVHGRPRPGHASKMSANGIFAMELDGELDASTPYGPAFSASYSERIHAARASSQPIQPVDQPSRDSQQALASSEALKAYLFSGHLAPLSGEANIGSTKPVAQQFPPSSRTQQQPSGHTSGMRVTGSSARSHHGNHSQESSAYAPRPSNRSSGLRQEVTPTKTPTRTPECSGPCAQSPQFLAKTTMSPTNDTDGNTAPRAPPSVPSLTTDLSSDSTAADLRGMEDSLRRILKLDSARGSGVVGGNLPAASASVPNYVGGRHPPLNGMHNGVMGS